MSRHNDDDPVLVGYESSVNISMRSHEPEELGVTWGEWREMNIKGRREVMNEYVHNLVDAWVEDDEDDTPW